jgi:hypothetical protein
MNPSTSGHVTTTATDRAPLDIWLYDTLIAQLHAAGSNRTRLTWSAEASERFGLGSRIVGRAHPHKACYDVLRSRDGTGEPA